MIFVLLAMLSIRVVVSTLTFVSLRADHTKDRVRAANWVNRSQFIPES